MRGNTVSAISCTVLLLACLTAGRAAAQTTSIEAGPLDASRQEALSLVNEVRREHGLAKLEPAAPLNAAAQSHAEDMLERNYYSHESPEGEHVQDRYLEHGGSRWRLVAENIATCAGCPTPPTRERVRHFHQGWMESPEHRRNILAEGLDTFGFGIAGGNGRVYAVQSFAGPGKSPGLQAGEDAAPLSPEEQLQNGLAAVNRVRTRENLQPLQSSEALTTVAKRVLDSGSGDRLIDPSVDLFKFLPGDNSAWRALNVVAAACGGCGTSANAADLRHFTDNWVENPQHREALLSSSATHLGLAINATGEGRKAAVAVIGESR